MGAAFEFDPAKSAANMAKHGIDFEEAQMLWDDEHLLELGTVQYGREERRIFIGERDGRCWTAVATSDEAASASSPSVVRETAKKWPTSAEAFDRMFDDGEDIDHLIDWSSARRPALDAKRVNVDFPTWMVERLDRHAKKRGVTRQALIKMWLADRLEAAG